MNHILQEIESRQEAFSQLPFFKFLEQGDRIEDARLFVSSVAFIVLSFQDMLRINEAQTTDPYLFPVAKHHRQEDLGHDLWFLNDIELLGVNCDAANLFSAQNTEARDAAFEIMAEIFKASDDRIRLVIPIVLEATGFTFFSRAYHFFERTGYQGQLQYFSKDHFQVELNHGLFDDEINDRVQSVRLTDELRQEALDVIDRIFGSITTMVTSIHKKIVANQSVAQRAEGSERLLVDARAVGALSS